MGELKIEKFIAAYERYADQNPDETGVSVHANVSLAIGVLLGAKMPDSAALLLRLYEEARPNDSGVEALKEYLGVG